MDYKSWTSFIQGHNLSALDKKPNKSFFWKYREILKNDFIFFLYFKLDFIYTNSKSNSRGVEFPNHKTWHYGTCKYSWILYLWLNLFLFMVRLIRTKNVTVTSSCYKKLVANISKWNHFNATKVIQIIIITWFLVNVYSRYVDIILQRFIF